MTFSTTRFMIRTALATLLVALVALPLRAQAVDTSSAADTVGPRPELRPPISPRRAFLSSLAFPGYGQSLLGRYRTGTILLAFEAVAIAMRHEMGADLREAKRNAIDSVAVSFVDENGNPLVTWKRTAFPTSLVRSRRSHLEDWTAVLIANHLFAAADAYVAALLWDLPSEVALRATPTTATVALRFDW